MCYYGGFSLGLQGKAVVCGEFCGVVDTSFDVEVVGGRGDYEGEYRGGGIVAARGGG